MSESLRANDSENDDSGQMKFSSFLCNIKILSRKQKVGDIGHLTYPITCISSKTATCSNNIPNKLSTSSYSTENNEMFKHQFIHKSDSGNAKCLTRTDNNESKQMHYGKKSNAGGHNPTTPKSSKITRRAIDIDNNNGVHSDEICHQEIKFTNSRKNNTKIKTEKKERVKLLAKVSSMPKIPEDSQESKIDSKNSKSILKDNTIEVLYSKRGKRKKFKNVILKRCDFVKKQKCVMEKTEIPKKNVLKKIKKKYSSSDGSAYRKSKQTETIIETSFSESKLNKKKGATVNTIPKIHSEKEKNCKDGIFEKKVSKLQDERYFDGNSRKVYSKLKEKNIPISHSQIIKRTKKKSDKAVSDINKSSTSDDEVNTNIPSSNYEMCSVHLHERKLPIEDSLSKTDLALENQNVNRKMSNIRKVFAKAPQITKTSKADNNYGSFKNNEENLDTKELSTASLPSSGKSFEHENLNVTISSEVLDRKENVLRDENILTENLYEVTANTSEKNTYSKVSPGTSVRRKSKNYTENFDTEKLPTTSTSFSINCFKHGNSNVISSSKISSRSQNFQLDENISAKASNEVLNELFGEDLRNLRNRNSSLCKKQTKRDNFYAVTSCDKDFCGLHSIINSGNSKQSCNCQKTHYKRNKKVKEQLNSTLTVEKYDLNFLSGKYSTSSNNLSKIDFDNRLVKVELYNKSDLIKKNDGKDRFSELDFIENVPSSFTKLYNSNYNHSLEQFSVDNKQKYENFEGPFSKINKATVNYVNIDKGGWKSNSENKNVNTVDDNKLITEISQKLFDKFKHRFELEKSNCSYHIPNTLYSFKYLIENHPNVYSSLQQLYKNKYEKISSTNESIKKEIKEIVRNVLATCILETPSVVDSISIARQNKKVKNYCELCCACETFIKRIDETRRTQVNKKDRYRLNEDCKDESKRIYSKQKRVTADAHCFDNFEINPNNYHREPQCDEIAGNIIKNQNFAYTKTNHVYYFTSSKIYENRVENCKEKLLDSNKNFPRFSRKRLRNNITIATRVLEDALIKYKDSFSNAENEGRNQNISVFSEINSLNDNFVGRNAEELCLKENCANEHSFSDIKSTVPVIEDNRFDPRNRYNIKFEKYQEIENISEDGIFFSSDNGNKSQIFNPILEETKIFQLPMKCSLISENNILVASKCETNIIMKPLLTKLSKNRVKINSICSNMLVKIKSFFTFKRRGKNKTKETQTSSLANNNADERKKLDVSVNEIRSTHSLIKETIPSNSSKINFEKDIVKTIDSQNLTKPPINFSKFIMEELTNFDLPSIKQGKSISDLEELQKVTNLNNSQSFQHLQISQPIANYFQQSIKQGDFDKKDIIQKNLEQPSNENNNISPAFIKNPKQISNNENEEANDVYNIEDIINSLSDEEEIEEITFEISPMRYYLFRSKLRPLHSKTSFLEILRVNYQVDDNLPTPKILPSEPEPVLKEIESEEIKRTKKIIEEITRKVTKKRKLTKNELSIKEREHINKTSFDENDLLNYIRSMKWEDHLRESRLEKLEGHNKNYYIICLSNFNDFTENAVNVERESSLDNVKELSTFKSSEMKETFAEDLTDQKKIPVVKIEVKEDVFNEITREAEQAESFSKPVENFFNEVTSEKSKTHKKFSEEIELLVINNENEILPDDFNTNEDVREIHCGISPHYKIDLKKNPNVKIESTPTMPTNPCKCRKNNKTCSFAVSDTCTKSADIIEEVPEKNETFGKEINTQTQSEHGTMTDFRNNCSVQVNLMKNTCVNCWGKITSLKNKNKIAKKVKSLPKVEHNLKNMEIKITPCSDYILIRHKNLEATEHSCIFSLSFSECKSKEDENLQKMKQKLTKTSCANLLSIPSQSSNYSWKSERMENSYKKNNDSTNGSSQEKRCEYTSDFSQVNSVTSSNIRRPIETNMLHKRRLKSKKIKRKDKKNKNFTCFTQNTCSVTNNDEKKSIDIQNNHVQTEENICSKVTAILSHCKPVFDHYTSFSQTPYENKTQQPSSERNLYQLYSANIENDTKFKIQHYLENMVPCTILDCQQSISDNCLSLSHPHQKSNCECEIDTPYFEQADSFYLGNSSISSNVFGENAKSYAEVPFHNHIFNYPYYKNERNPSFSSSCNFPIQNMNNKDYRSSLPFKKQMMLSTETTDNCHSNFNEMKQIRNRRLLNVQYLTVPVPLNKNIKSLLYNEEELVQNIDEFERIKHFSKNQYCFNI